MNSTCLFLLFNMAARNLKLYTWLAIFSLGQYCNRGLMKKERKEIKVNI